MATGIKISTLPELPSLASDDLFHVVDDSAVSNRKFKYSSLLTQLNSEVVITESQISDLQSYALTATTLTFNGTANEVEITGGTQSLASNRTWTVGLPDDVSITNDISAGSAAPTAIAHLTRKDYVDGELSTGLALKLDKTGGTISSNLIISGDLTVNGTTTTINTELVTADAVINMNDGEAGAGVTLGFSGLQIDRGSSNNYWLGFDEVRDSFSVGEITSLSAGQIATTQLVATRIDSPTDGYWGSWDSGNSRFDFVNPESLTFDLQYSADHSSGYTSRSLIDQEYHSKHLGGQDVDALITTPTVTEDGKIIAWNDGNSEYELVSAGVGDVIKVGTPVNDQIGVWTGDGTMEGDANITWDGNSLDITGAVVSSGNVSGIGIGIDMEWTQVGNDLNISGIGGPQIVSLSSTRVAFLDTTLESLRTYDFDGTNWAQVGNGLTIAGISSLGLAALSGNRIAFVDVLLDNLRTYDFDGTDWAQVGNSLAITTVGVPSITALSGARIAYTDATNRDLRTYDFDGTDWAQVGNDLNISGITDPSITALSSTRIAFIDDTNDDLRTYDFDGTDWAQVGNDLNISGITAPGITALSSNRIAFIDDVLELLKVYNFNGNDWEQYGSTLNISGISLPSITTLGSTRIAFIDTTLEDLRTYDLVLIPNPSPALN